MNIVLYINSFLPQIGGREMVVHHLARSYKEMGHSVRVIGPAGWSQNNAVDFGYPVYRYPSIGFSEGWRETQFDNFTNIPKRATLRTKLHEFIKLSELYLDIVLRGGDLIHAHNTYPTGYLAGHLHRLKKIPLVITPHGEDIHVIPEMKFGLRLNPVLQPKILEAVNEADAVTAISASIESSLLDAGAPSEKIHAIPNGVDVERFEQLGLPDAFEYLGVKNDSKLIVTIGNYHPRKGQEFLIRAMPKILSRHDTAKLVIIGRGQEPLQTVVDELNLADSVILAGIIPVPVTLSALDDTLASILTSSHIYVSAGMDEGAEGLSLALLEAMAASLPIVATDISGNRDIVEEGINGCLVPPADSSGLAEAINNLLSNESARETQSLNAKNTALKYHWREIAKQYLDTYNNVIEKSVEK